jgi:hypothetical protein
MCLRLITWSLFYAWNVAGGRSAGFGTRSRTSHTQLSTTDSSVTPKLLHRFASMGRSTGCVYPRSIPGPALPPFSEGPEHGRLRIAPSDQRATSKRRYRGGPLVLETEFQVGDGIVRLIDFMSPRPDIDSGHTDLMRIVEGVSGRVPNPMKTKIHIHSTHGCNSRICP